MAGPKRVRMLDTAGRVVVTAVVTLGVVLAVMIAMSVRYREMTPGSVTDIPRALRPSPRELVVLGWSQVLGGGNGRRPGPYYHEAVLADGRRVRFTARTPFGGRTCIRLRVREEGQRLIVLDAQPAAERCPSR